MVLKIFMHLVNLNYVNRLFQVNIIIFSIGVCM